LSALYIKYNHALNEIFFSGRFAWRPVYLSLDAKMRLELAEILDEDEEGLEEKICRVVGHVLNKTGDPYESMNSQAKMWWRKSRSSPPPFTALLFTLSHAAALMAAEGDFGSNNYYLRLAQITGRERQVLSVKGKSTDQLWGFLNLWLVENNYELGRPTAVAINSWKYVGKALSQVVVRASDRELFHDLFSRCGFSGNEDISPDEMRHYLANWMVTSKPNARLKAAWQKPELRQRVCEAAAAELTSWGNDDCIFFKESSFSENRSIKLSLIASFITRFPRPTMLDLQLGRSEERNEPLRPLSLNAAPEQEFALANEDFGTFATILPRLISPEERSLSRSYSFIASDKNIQLDWRSRLVIPLARANDGPYWIEVSRVTFGQPHIILVRNIANFPNKVESYLSDAALEMPEKIMPSDLPGLPPDWILYKDARLGTPSSTPPLDLETLVPIADDGALIVEGSFQLARGIFHSRSKLSVSFLASTGPTELIALSLSAQKEIVLKQVQETGKACRLELSSEELVESSLRLEGRRSRNLVASVEVLLRDAGLPRALDRQQSDALSYSNPISASVSVSHAEQVSSVMVTGMAVYGISQAHSVIETQSLNKELPSGELEELQDIAFTNLILKHVIHQTCAERGYHIWLCETLEPGRPKKTPLRQECKDCAQAIVVVDRGKATSRVLDVGLRPMKSALASTGPSLPIIDHDLLFDALCFLGTGSWGKFESLLADKVDMPWQAHEIVCNYALLGLLDIELRQGTNIIRRWSVPDCAASFIGEKTAFLAGFRCLSILDSISTAVECAGGKIIQTQRLSAPTHIEIVGLSPAQLSEALKLIIDPLGRAVSIHQNTGQKIARACMEWDGIECSVSPISIGRQENMQFFNLNTARWETVNSIGSEGAYRWNDGKQTYAYVDKNRHSLVGPYQVVKLMAARAQQVQLHTYDIKRREFLAALGCDAPGLLGRALVVCSGGLPEVSGGLLKYSNVDPQTAQYVLDLMYKKEEVYDETSYAHQRH
tara:strand:- start:233556 stop:236576 length:3021 start_codon:yes stop_codon:yes gene_type:complete